MISMDDRLKEQIDFILEIDKMKEILRQNYLADGSARENDADHSWHLAMMALVLSEYSNEKVDVTRVVPMVLTHDLVEIDAGDTYAYDEAGALTKEKREKAAADRIFGILPKEQGTWMRGLWNEFEACNTPESKFAHVLDNSLPLFLNHAAGGISWKEHKVKRSQIYKRNRITGDGSAKIWEYMQELIQENINKGNIIDDRS
ncbi:HD domain-containing protein [Blautia sp. 1033sp1_1033st1_G9_1033SCRN_220408]|uniref:HD domain-containing protein n=1 Tax=Blautia sp. 1033sp1_1033st1_G9_1033SCRN_220408 TaxID=3144490 RepID=UPI0034A5120C